MEDSMNERKKTKTMKSRRESAVQGTNDSSIVSKCSMAALGYFDDPYLQCFVSKVTRRAPLIHRGYYVRAKTLDYILKSFLTENPGKKQIVSLGAGFDSAYFRLQSQNLLAETVFYEVDYPEVVKRKCALIKVNPEIYEMIGHVDTLLTEKSPLIELSTDSYKLLGVDLSQINTLEAVLNLCHVDLDVPTLFLSECVLTYMTRRCASNVVRWAGETFNNSMFVLYEQINPNDAFGLFMQHHFHTVGSPLKSINAFPTLQAQRDRFSKLGWCDVEALDMNQFYFSLLSSEERERIENVELFDEYEEWHLKCAHYMVLCGYRGNCTRLLVRDLPVPVENYSPNLEGMNDVITYDKNNNVGGLRLFSHVTADSGNGQLVCVGGFGEQKGKHMRVSDITLIDCKTLSVTRVNPGVDNSKIQVSRMHPTLTCLKDGRLILIGGRLSPMKLCTQTVTLCLKSGQKTSQEIAMEADQSTSGIKREGNVMGGLIKCEKENCSKMNCDEKSMNCDNKCDSNIESNVINVIESNCDNSSNKENKISNNMSIEIENRPNNDANIIPNDSKNFKNPVNSAGNEAKQNCDNDVIIECSVIEQTGDIPCSRWRHSAILHDNKGEDMVVIFGGRTQTVLALGDCYKFNPQTAEWFKVEGSGEIPCPRQSHSASVWRGHMIIAGGLQADLRPLSSIYMLDLENWTWRLLPTDILPRYSHTAHIFEDFLVLLGGVNCHHSPPGVAVVHLPSGQSAEFPLPKQDKENLVMLHRHTGVAMETGRIVVLGGGGNCFSFGTHLNSSPFIVDVSGAIRHMKSKLGI